MEERNIVLTVRGDTVKRSGNQAGVQHEAAAVTVTFAFDGTWDGYAKTVTFWDAHGLNPVKVLLGEAEKIAEREYAVPMPAEAMKAAGCCTLVIDGVKEGARQRAAQTRLEVVASPIAVFPDEVTATVAEQLQVEIETHTANTDIHVTAEKQAAWSGKQDAIADLDAIREGAGKGMDAVPKAWAMSQASESNPLADRDFVNQSVSTNTANYISDNGHPFASVEALEAYTGPLTNNDYAIVVSTDGEGNTEYKRYKWSADTEAWAFEYAINSASFPPEQWAAIRSGITAALVEAYNAHVADEDIHVTEEKKQAWDGKQDAITDLETIREGAQAGAMAKGLLTAGIGSSNIADGAVTEDKIGTAVSAKLNGKADRYGEESIIVEAEKTAASIKVVDGASGSETVIKDSGIETAKVSGLAAIADSAAADVAAPKGYVDRKLTEVANIEDGKVKSTSVWSSKHLVDTLCSPFTATAEMATCYPVAGYPMTFAETHATEAPVTVWVAGKNLFRGTYRDYSLWETSSTNKRFYADLLSGKYTITIKMDTSKTHTGTLYFGTYSGSWDLREVYNGTSTYTRTFEVGQGKVTGIMIQTIAASQSALDSVLNGIVSIQLEMGDTGTAYEEYKGYSVHIDEAGTLTALPGVNHVWATYNHFHRNIVTTVTGREDPTHTIEELKQAIISLGGNV